MKSFCLVAVAAGCVIACGSDHAVESSSPDSGSTVDGGSTTDAPPAADAGSLPDPDCTADVHQWAPCPADQARCSQRCTPCGAEMFTTDAVAFTCQPNPAVQGALEWATLDEVDCYPQSRHCAGVYTDALCTQPLSCP